MYGVLFLWAVLQYNRVMAEYVDMNLKNHPDILAVIVEHLIKMRVLMEQQQKLKDEADMCRSTIKAFSSSVGKLESRMERAEHDIKNKNKE
jgi:hypothetical protein